VSRVSDVTTARNDWAGNLAVVRKPPFGLYGSASYREKINAGQSPAFIGFDQDSDFIAEAKWLARQFGDQRFSFRTNSQTTQAAAARAGYGVALLP
jgi:hypothetical protein